MDTNPLFTLACDLYNGTRLPEQTRPLCDALSAFIAVSEQFKSGDATYWQWVRALAVVVEEMRKL